MIKLPKISEYTSPSKNQYNYIIMSKINLKVNKSKIKSSKYDWISCELAIVQHLTNQSILKQLVNFQLLCKQKNIQSFYSYFFLKSLFLNKNLPTSEPTLNKQGQQKQNYQYQSQKIKLGQVQVFIIECLQSQGKRIQTQTSLFNKIQNCINLRQKSLKQIQQITKQQSHNFIHQHVNNIRFLNFEILNLIKSWKLQLMTLQLKTFIINNNHNHIVNNAQNKNQLKKQDQLIIQPFFAYQNQNYLNKIIYDNASVINTCNLKKQLNFISPPNPFFLSQDGNKQSMSQTQKHNIQQAMEYFTKQKAFQLKIMLEKPQYIAKEQSLKDRVRSASKKNQKSLPTKQQSQKRLSASLQKNQTIHKSYGLIKPKNIQKNQQIKDKKTSTYNERQKYTQRQNLISVYQQRATKLRQQIQKSSSSRIKLDTLINRPLLKVKLSQSKLVQSPYKQKISSLRRQVQKNVASIKYTKQQPLIKIQKIQKVQDDKLSMNGTQKSFKKSSLIQIKTPKPKMKLITQRQVDVDRSTKNPIAQLLARKNTQQAQKQKSEQKSKQKIKQISKQKSKQKSLDKSLRKQKQNMRRSSFSTFFKSAQQQQMQKSNIKQNKMSSSKLKLSPANIKRSNSANKIVSVKTSTNFLYKPNKLSSTIQNYVKQETKRKRTQQSKKINDQNNIKLVDNQLRNLKQRVRQMQILKAYSNKSPSRKRLSHSNLQAIRQDPITMNQRLQNSPYRKDQSSNRSVLLKKQAQMLQKKLQRLLHKQQQSTNGLMKHDSMSIRQQDETIYNEYRTVIGDSIKNKYELNNELPSASMLMDEKLMKLQKKKELIQQGNEIKQKQIQKNKREKQKISSQIQQRKKRLQQLQNKISEMKRKRKTTINKSQSRIKQSIIQQRRKSILGQQQQQQQGKVSGIRKLKQYQSQIKKKNQQLQKEMIYQQQKFIKLKQQQFKIRQQHNRNKYLQSIQQMRTNYQKKQQQYESRILQQQKNRKQHQIKLIKQKRQTQQLQIKLQQQQMKQLLLKQLLQTQKYKYNHYIQSTNLYQKQIINHIQLQLHLKQQQQIQLNSLYQQQNVRLIKFMNQIKQKNIKIQISNNKKLQQLQSTIKLKQIQTNKLSLLQNQIHQQQQLKQKQSSNNHQQVNKIFNNNKFNSSNKLYDQQTQSLSIMESQSDNTETLKLKLKQQILKQIINRRQIQQQQQLQFELQRKIRMQQLQNQIKQFLKKQHQIHQSISSGHIQQVDAKIAQLKANHLSTTPITMQQSLPSPKKQPQTTPPPDNKISPNKQSHQKQPVLNSNNNIQTYNVRISQTPTFMNPIIQPQYQNKQNIQKMIKSRDKLSLTKLQQEISNLVPTKDIINSGLTQKKQLNTIIITNNKHSKPQIIPIKQKLPVDQIQLQSKVLKQQKKQFKIYESPQIQQKQQEQKLQRQPVKNKSPNKQLQLIQSNKPKSHQSQQKYILQSSYQEQKKKSPKKQQDSLIQPQPRRQKSPKKRQEQSYQLSPPKIDRSSKQNPAQRSQRIQSSSKKLRKQKDNAQQNRNQKTNTQNKFGQKYQQQRDNILKREQQLQNSTILSRSKDKDEQTSSAKQTILSPNEEVTQKYQVLKQFLNKRAKFIIIEESQIQQFVTKFYSSLSQQVRQMQIYSQQQMLKILTNYKTFNKKIDLFDCNSIGWFSPQSMKYTLFGSFECVHLIARKYGQIQVQMAYYFNKGNINQKLYLSKQIKIFQKVGYVYQKRLKKQNQFSIKLILKIPRQVVPKGLQTPEECVKFRSKISLHSSTPGNKDIQSIQKHNNIFFNLLGDCLNKNNSSGQLQQQYKISLNQSVDVNLFIKQLKQFQSSQLPKQLKSYICHKQNMTSQLMLSFNLPYIQIGSITYLSLNVKQYQLNKGQKVYLTQRINNNQQNYNQNKWKFLIYQTQKDQLQDQYLQTILDAKIKQINKLKHIKQLNLLIPAFKFNSNFTLKNNQDFKQNFTYKSNIKNNLITSSISSAQSLKSQQTKIIKLTKNYQDDGFVFCVCYCQNQIIQKVLTGSWIGYQNIIN